MRNIPGTTNPVLDVFVHRHDVAVASAYNCTDTDGRGVTQWSRQSPEISHQTLKAWTRCQ